MGDLTENFSRKEFACPCPRCEGVTPAVDIELVNAMQDSVDYFGGVLGRRLIAKVTSGNRCPEHNAEVGGKPKSSHVAKTGADYFIMGVPINQLADYLETQAERDGVDKWGIGKYNTHVHLDVRRGTRARWTEV